MAKRRALQPPATSGETAPVQPSPRATPKVRREVTSSPTFIALYTNDVQIQTTPYDVRLTLGEISVEPGEEIVARVKQIGEVRMSPQLAKRVTMLMAQQLRAYEQAFGPIPLPAEED